jgi:ubiquinone/menaquinone biosynthesis C-methylase UbiE
VIEDSPYDRLAEEYAGDAETSPWNALYERPATLALLPPLEGKRVLDVGCGSGPLTARLVEQGASVVGVDASAAMIAIAERRELAGAEFVVADLGRPLSFLADASFDVVVASVVLHYLRDWTAPLRELRRVLRAGGSFVVSTHHPAWDVTLGASGDYFATELIHDCWTKGGRDFEVTYWRRPLTDMVAAILDAGFRIETIVEPQPVEECRAHPDDWRKLTTQPVFLFFGLVAV